jgi:hypothetical protein
MTAAIGRRLARTVAVTLVASLGSVGPSTAESAPTALDPTIIELPAGSPFAACAFTLRIEIRSAKNPVIQEFKDRNGNVVRLLRAGKGDTLVFTNVDTQRALAPLTTGGSVMWTKLNPDGSATVALTGHNVLILFPTDVGGPSTTLYIGRVVYTVDTAGVFAVQSSTGSSTDICALLTL